MDLREPVEIRGNLWHVLGKLSFTWIGGLVYFKESPRLINVAMLQFRLFNSQILEFWNFAWSFNKSSVSRFFWVTSDPTTICFLDSVVLVSHGASHCQCQGMFVSHQWASNRHADPGGRQLRVLQGEIWQLNSPIGSNFQYMGVSENGGTPKSSILIGFSIINHPFWGTPIFGNTHI